MPRNDTPRADRSLTSTRPPAEQAVLRLLRHAGSRWWTLEDMSAALDGEHRPEIVEVAVDRLLEDALLARFSGPHATIFSLNLAGVAAAGRALSAQMELGHVA